jgi:hypothetical protein
MIQPCTSCCDPEEPSLRVIPQGMLTNIGLIPTIREEVIAAQRMDLGMGHIRRRLELGEVKCFREDVDGVLWFKNRLVIHKDFELCRKIMDEAHCSRYSIHPGTNKIKGQEKATRGGESESIKIPRRNLAYIPKSVGRPLSSNSAKTVQLYQSY